MRKDFILGLIIIFALILGLYFLVKLRSNRDNLTYDDLQINENLIEGGENMKLVSEAFNQNQKIPSKYTCDGENINPPLSILGIPPETKSLSLVVNDPDAPGGDWVHWVVWNIDPSTTQIKEKEIPEGIIQGTNDFGKKNYGGPCPPMGTHKYQFSLYALDTTLDLPSSTSKSDFLKNIEGHVLDQTMLVGLYSKE